VVFDNGSTNIKNNESYPAHSQTYYGREDAEFSRFVASASKKSRYRYRCPAHIVMSMVSVIEHITREQRVFAH
jgi:hypothetical protein